MAISIIVEDGSIVQNANSYVSIENMRTFAAERGVTLPENDDDIATMIIKSTDYLESLHCQYVGEPVDENQPLEWPRKNAYVNCKLIPETLIPKQLINAQKQLVLALEAGFDLQPNVSFSDYVTEEKVGPITTKYSDPAQLQIRPTLTAADTLLKIITEGCGSNMRYGFSSMRG